MPKINKPLRAVKVNGIVEEGCHNLGRNLYKKIKGNSRLYMLRYTMNGRTRDMSLGSCSKISLADARAQVREAQELIIRGRDPIEERRERKAKSIASRSTLTFDQATNAAHGVRSPGFRSDKHDKEWIRSVKKHISPYIGSFPVDQVNSDHIVKAIRPIWGEKTETARRVLQRVEFIMDWATAHEYRKGDNPARWKNRLEFALTDPRKITKVQHFKALPVNEMPSFMGNLRKQEGIAARALEFVILTAARSGEIRGATWDEINIQDSLWIIPEDRMKSGRKHRVPLSNSAIEILSKIPRFTGNKHVFPAPRGGMLSDMALPNVLKRMGIDAVPHGFRSTFRDWCSEQDNYDREVSERALAHRIGSATETAYRRSDQLEKRRKLMREWDNFLNSHKSTDEDSLIGKNENAA